MNRLRSISGSRAASEPHSKPLEELWAGLAGATSAHEIAAPFLELQCRLLPGVRHGLLVLGPPDRGPFEVAAAWPETEESPAGLLEGAEQAIARRKGLIAGAVERAAEPEVEAEAEDATPLRTSLIAHPVIVDGKLRGAVVFDLAPRTGEQLRELLARVRWGTGWIDSALRRGGSRLTGSRKDRVELVPNLLAATLDQESFDGAARAFVTDLATELRCDRVSIGFIARGRARVAAISHSSHVGKKTNLIRAIEAAMDEAIGQQTRIVQPAKGGAFPTASHAHQDLARQHGSGAICTVPVVHAGRVCGAMTLERPEERPFDERSVQICEVTACVIAPVLEIMQREERAIAVKAWRALREQISKLTGPRHVAFKLGTGAALLLLVLMATLKGDYRVTSDAILEPAILRASAAPFNAYLAEAPVRPGDVVRKGDLLGRLDDRELRLDRAKWVSQREQLLKQYRQALAGRDAPQAEIFAASLQEANAELERIEDLLARTDVRAPFDGVVISGDLTQQLGAPVEKGAVLFEVAPLDAYRVILEVDETDVADVQPGQTGKIVFSSLPTDSHAFVVEKLTPVAQAEEGVNFFRVEARLLESSGRLRPAIEGVAKIEIDRRRLLWIWTHKLVDWLRLTTWRWLP